MTDVNFWDKNSADYDRWSCQITDGWKPIHFISAIGQCDSYLSYVETFPHVKMEVDCNGNSALHYAGLFGHSDRLVGRILLSSDGIKNSVNDFGQTPLHLACASGNLMIVKMLYIKNQKKHLVADEGETPLHMAALFGHLEICKYLISRLTNDIASISYQSQLDVVHPEDDHGKTPYNLACEKGYNEVASYLFFKHPF